MLKKTVVMAGLVAGLMATNAWPLDFSRMTRVMHDAVEKVRENPSRENIEDCKSIAEVEEGGLEDQCSSDPYSSRSQLDKCYSRARREADSWLNQCRR